MNLAAVELLWRIPLRTLEAPSQVSACYTEVRIAIKQIAEDPQKPEPELAQNSGR